MMHSSGQVGPRAGLRWLGAALLALTAWSAPAQTPASGSRALDFVVIFPAGASADVSARILADGIAQNLNTPVAVSNRPGGGGAVGYKYVAAARPDGRTFVWNSNSISTTHYSGVMDIDYKAFEPVARVTIELPVVVVQASSPWKTLNEMLDYARVNPGMLKVGNSGTGSHTHMASAALFDAAGAKVLEVPFSATQVVPSLLGGHVDALVQLPGAVVPHVKSGALRVLGGLGSTRDPVFPDVPTARETGLVMLPMDLWRGIGVPKGTPKAAIARLEKAVEAALRRPEFASAGQKFGFVPAYLPSAEFGRLIARDDAIIARQMTALGMTKAR
jgi:tripartite-type tricarboxylate transporter receptor subunit TctC